MARKLLHAGRLTPLPIGLEAFDEVVLLERGRVAARGRHADLLGDPRYRALLGLSGG